MQIVLPGRTEAVHWKDGILENGIGGDDIPKAEENTGPGKVSKLQQKRGAQRGNAGARVW